MTGLRGRRVLVTGAAGFIGSHLTERLVAEGAEVRAFVRYNSQSSRGWLDTLGTATQAAIETFRGDLKDPDAVRRSVCDRDLVLHLGALIAIPYSYTNPLDFVQTNVVGTAHVLGACRQAGVERVVLTSTSEVYGTAQHAPITEQHPLVGQSPYSASKIGADQLGESYFRAFDLPVVTARPFNTYGPRQSARAIIPAIAVQCLAGIPVKLGSLTPTRDLTYVEDVVDGFVQLATTPGIEGEVVQLGSGKEISIGALAACIAERCGSEASITEDPSRLRPGPSEVHRLVSDPDKARRLLGWRASTSIEQGLDRTLDWLGRNTHRYRVDQYET
jgi:dTDP-glucose 4,6-dehydratase